MAYEGGVWTPGRGVSTLRAVYGLQDAGYRLCGRCMDSTTRGINFGRGGWTCRCGRSAAADEDGRVYLSDRRMSDNIEP